MPKRSSMPEDILIAETHEYVQVLEESRIRVGVTEFALESLGEVTFVDLPDIGDVLEQGESFATIESEARQSELYAPVSGEIIAINSQLEESPELINDDTYGAGWVIEMDISDITELGGLASGEAYLELLEK